MDDCNLKNLKVKPGELSPVFKPDAVEYKVTVGSKVSAVTILCETSDKGASVSISVSICLHYTSDEQISNRIEVSNLKSLHLKI